MKSSLVLNATFEPLSVVTCHRAVCLILGDRADLVADDGSSVHSISLSVPTPSVIRLRTMVHVPFRRRVAVSRRLPCSPATTIAASTAVGLLTRSTTSCPAREAAPTNGRTSPLRVGRATCASAIGHQPKRTCPWLVRRVNRVTRRGSPLPCRWCPRPGNRSLPSPADRLNEAVAAAQTADWDVQMITGEAEAFHQQVPETPADRSIWVFNPERPTMVLGSSQPADAVDAAACQRAGVAIVRRRSGGGAVLVIPGEMVWVDVVIPRHDPLWDDDVGRAMHWIGEAWRQAIDPTTLQIHDGRLLNESGAVQVCFAGRGPGEVVVAAQPSKKVVGISQRRTAGWARFQTMAHRRWRPDLMAELLTERPDRDLLAEAVDVIDDPSDDLIAALLRCIVDQRVR